MPLSMSQLNALDAEAFITTLGGVFEHSPWVPAAILEQRPFASLEALAAALMAAVEQAPSSDQLALICAYPPLGGEVIAGGEAAPASVEEQQVAGLDRCSPQEYAELHALNGEYLERFGFPFVLAVRAHRPASVIAELRRRLQRPVAEELAENLHQIEQVARWRLQRLLQA